MLDSSIADEIQHFACNLTCLLKDNHSFLFASDYDKLMSLLYLVIDLVDDFI